MMKKICILSILLLIIYFYQYQICYALGVTPLLVDLEMRPGETTNFTINLLPTNRQQIVNIDLYEPQQNLNGSLFYIPEEISNYEALNWVDIPNRIIIPPNQQAPVAGEVSVPFGTEGSYTVVIMIEEDIEDMTGIQISYRYAVRLNINIPQPWLREVINILEFSLNPDQRGRPEILVHIENPSKLFYGAYGEVAIRDESRRLVERVVLGTAAGTQGTRIYPGAEVQFKRLVSAPLFPGNYDLRLFLRYADGKQTIRNMQIQIEDEFLIPETLRYLEASPNKITTNLRPGGSNTSVIELKNLTGDKLSYKLEVLDLFPGYDRSVFSELDFQLRSSGMNLISSRGNDRLMKMIRAPREVSDGGYYGNIEISVLSQNGTQLENQLIELEVIVGTNKVIALELRDLSAFLYTNESILSLSVRNTGNIAFAPRATAYIYNEKDEIIHTVTLSLAEDIDRILPSFSGFLVGNFGDIEDIDDGIYKVLVKAELTGETLAESQFMVEFKSESGDF